MKAWFDRCNGAKFPEVKFWQIGLPDEHVIGVTVFLATYRDFLAADMNERLIRPNFPIYSSVSITIHRKNDGDHALRRTCRLADRNIGRFLDEGQFAESQKRDSAFKRTFPQLYIALIPKRETCLLKGGRRKNTSDQIQFL
ncbi:hypothetical protein EDC31_11431 [Acidomonas methanolica]|nr:hypothetical protein EDC31_11431 [Acidomonas methanolica]